MLKKISFVNYKKYVYKIFIKEDNLYYSAKESFIKIGQDVKDYCLKYFNDSIWVSFYDKEYKIYLFEISLKDDDKIEQYLNINGKKYLQKINLLDIAIIDKNKINLIFCGCNKDKNFLFNYKIKESNKINILSDEINIKNKNPFIIYSYSNKVNILFCEKKFDEEYIIYDLIDNVIISNFKLFNVKSMFLIKYKKKPIIFYTIKVDKYFEIRYRYLNIDNSGNILKCENYINLSKYINNPIISSFMNKVYIIWNNKNEINIAKSYNLEDWELNTCKNNLVEGSLIKIIDNNIEKLNTYFNEDILEKYINNKNKYTKSNKIINLLEDDIIQNKINYINNISNLTKRYNKKYNEYLKKISELNKIIDEKDKLIVNLLNKKK